MVPCILLMKVREFDDSPWFEFEQTEELAPLRRTQYSSSWLFFFFFFFLTLSLLSFVLFFIRVQQSDSQLNGSGRVLLVRKKTYSVSVHCQALHCSLPFYSLSLSLSLSSSLSTPPVLVAQCLLLFTFPNG